MKVAAWVIIFIVNDHSSMFASPEKKTYKIVIWLLTSFIKHEPFGPTKIPS